MAHVNLYHVFYKMPALNKEDMYVELEELAQQFVNSGLLRIDAEPKQNFTRFSQPTRNVHIVFSKRELYEEHLKNRVYKKLYKAFKDAGMTNNIDSSISKEVSKLRDQLNKHIEVEPELEMKLARILVQSAHPVVILMIIFEQVEVFVSYGHNIGEVMDIVSWSQAGTNSGMQSTDGKNVAVFISCGGDPLMLDPAPKQEIKDYDKNIEEERLFGDGTPALARMMGIAGQETGHYSDIIHDAHGRQIGRYSANFSGTKANERVNLARNTDLNNINIYWNKLNQIGLDKLIESEKEIKFLKRYPNKSISYYYKFMIMKFRKYRLIYLTKKMGFWPIDNVKNKDYTGIRLEALFSDMAFNLEPVADVYRNPDKNIEIAIACIEALARVPQQANKWGHRATLFFWRNLYKFYYYKLIPGCIANYEHLTGKKFTLHPNMFRRYNWKEKLSFKLEVFKQKVKSKFKLKK